MKYCKKCFRNVREDVNICPYCGAPGLEEYGSSKFGEDFSCSHTTETRQAIKDEAKSFTRQDAYSKTPEQSDPFSTNEEDTADAYGNIGTKGSSHSPSEDAYGNTHRDNCDNAPDSPKALSPYSPNSNALNPMFHQDKMRIEYLAMLKNIPNITQERIDQLMEQYDKMHGNATSDTKVTYKNIGGKHIKVVTKNSSSSSSGSDDATREFVEGRIKDLKERYANGDDNVVIRHTETRSSTSTTNVPVVILVTLLFAAFGFANPIFGIIAMAIFRVAYAASPELQKHKKLPNVLMTIYIVEIVGFVLIAIIGALDGSGLLEALADMFFDSY